MSRFNGRILAVAVAALAVAAGSGAAIAASRGSSPSPTAFLDSVAKHLGISTEKLRDATKAAALEQVDAALEAGTITQAQADALEARIESGEVVPFFGPGFGFGGFHGGMHPFGDRLSAAADYLGVTEVQLREKLAAGQSLADVAKAQGKSVDGLKQAMLDAAKKNLDQAVKDGGLTQSQADALYSHLKSEIDDIVNGTFRGRHRFGPPHGSHYFGGGPAGIPFFGGAPA